MIIYFHGSGRRAMSFDDKYEILAELRNDGIKTSSRERNNRASRRGGPVSTGRTPENSAILDKIQRLGPDQRQFILETGDHLGPLLWFPTCYRIAAGCGNG